MAALGFSDLALQPGNILLQLVQSGHQPFGTPGFCLTPALSTVHGEAEVTRLEGLVADARRKPEPVASPVAS